MPPHDHIREPESNVYGRFKVLRRTDGKYVVHNMDAWPPNGPVFNDEETARRVAQQMAAES